MKKNAENLKTEKLKVQPRQPRQHFSISAFQHFPE